MGLAVPHWWRLWSLNMLFVLIYKNAEMTCNYVFEHVVEVRIINSPSLWTVYMLPYYTIEYDLLFKMISKIFRYCNSYWNQIQCWGWYMMFFEACNYAEIRNNVIMWLYYQVLFAVWFRLMIWEWPFFDIHSYCWQIFGGECGSLCDNLVRVYLKNKLTWHR